jgi:hypothetical protein
LREAVKLFFRGKSDKMKVAFSATKNISKVSSVPEFCLDAIETSWRTGNVAAAEFPIPIAIVRIMLADSTIQSLNHI